MPIDNTNLRAKIYLNLNMIKPVMFINLKKKT